MRLEFHSRQTINERELLVNTQLTHIIEYIFILLFALALKIDTSQALFLSLSLLIQQISLTMIIQFEMGIDLHEKRLIIIIHSHKWTF